MRWISHYQLFLFDLDGLLVNTEELHYLAYVRMCKDRGFQLPWDFPTYFRIAGLDAEALERHIYQQFPELKAQEPRWEILYAEKKRAFLELLQKEPVPLFPGVEKLLLKLQEEKIKRCVVTHSSRQFVDILKQQNPILDTISHWFSREDYGLPKPSPDGYLRAIATLAEKGDRIIGFEDSIRGMNALRQTPATPILINNMDAATHQFFSGHGIRTFRTFEEVLQVEQDVL